MRRKGEEKKNGKKSGGERGRGSKEKSWEALEEKAEKIVEDFGIPEGKESMPGDVPVEVFSVPIPESLLTVEEKKKKKRRSRRRIVRYRVE